MKAGSLVVIFLILNFLVAKSEINVSFSHYKVEDGLSQRTVRCIHQDSYGFLWFGTDNGLNKFDGTNFRVYRHQLKDSTSLSSSYIFVIYEDRQRNLWIGTGFDGLNLFDRAHDTFIHFKTDVNDSNSLSNNNIRSIYEDTKGNLWIGTDGGGLNLFDKKTNKFKRYFVDPSRRNRIGSNYINSIVEDDSGNLWLSSLDGQLIYFDTNRESFENFSFYQRISGNFSSPTYWHLLLDEGKLWIGTDTGLAYMDIASRRIFKVESSASNSFISNNPISSIVKYGSDMLIFGSDHGGLFFYNKRKNEFELHKHNAVNPKSIPNNQVFTLYTDKDKNLWVGNFGGGVSRLNVNDTKFNTIYNNVTTLPEYQGSVLAFAEDKTGSIWMGTDGDGVYLVDKGSLKLTKPLFIPKSLERVVVDIFVDAKGIVWFGTYREGLVRYDPEKKSFEQFKNRREDNTSIRGNSVWAFCQDVDGNLIISILGAGMDVMDTKTKEFSHYRNIQNDTSSLSNNDVFRLTPDIDGQIWVGTRNGLNKFDPKNRVFERFNKNGLIGSWIYDVFLDKSKTIWVGTDRGLNKFDRKNRKFIHCPDIGGFAEIAVMGILEDENGDLWISTINGLSRYNVADKSFRHYDTSDGLLSTVFNYSAQLRTKEGLLFYGEINGFNYFNPKHIKDNDVIPPIYLTDFKVFNKSLQISGIGKELNKSINLVDTIRLSYTQSVLTFEFAALNYVNNKKNQYAYFLDGFDNEWNFIGNKHEVTYTNLNPGEYTFCIKGSNNDGAWNEVGQNITLLIKPPFYKTAWFYFLQIFVATGLIYLFIAFRTKRLTRQKRLLLSAVKERTAKIELQTIELERHQNHLESEIVKRTYELKAAKEKAEESDRLKTAFLANMSHEIRTPMNAIIGFSELMNDNEYSSEEKRGFMQSIKSGSDALLSLIQDILDLSKIEANQLKIDYNWYVLNSFLNELEKVIVLTKHKDGVTFIKRNELETWELNVYGDSKRVRQILINLIDNAFKFTDRGHIILEVSLQNKTICFSVKDSGIGISKENMPMVFDRFKKFADDETRIFGGTGLGLSISLNLARMMQGDLTVSSALGEGSEFVLRLPINTEGMSKN